MYERMVHTIRQVWFVIVNMDVNDYELFMQGVSDWIESTGIMHCLVNMLFRSLVKHPPRPALAALLEFMWLKLSHRRKRYH